jgi:hypothetical protein
MNNNDAMRHKRMCPADGVRSGVWKLSSIDGEAVWGNLIDNGHFVLIPSKTSVLLP